MDVGGKLHGIQMAPGFGFAIVMHRAQYTALGTRASRIGILNHDVDSGFGHIKVY